MITEIEKLLNDIGKSLKDYQTMPFPPDIFRCTDLNRLIFKEISYDRAEIKYKHDAKYCQLNADKKSLSLGS